MKILYIINSLDGGGGALPLPDVIDVMRDAGHAVLVVSLMERDGRARPLLSAAGIPYVVIGGAKRRFASTAIRLDKLIWEWRPDMLWTSLTHATITGEIAGLMRGIPVTSWLHNAWLKPINRRILRQTARFTRHWVADSRTVADFGAESLGIDPANISIWPLFIARETAVVTRTAGPQFRLGSLGRLHRNKGYDQLIRAVHVLQRETPEIAAQLSVHIAGEGAELPSLQALCKSLNVHNVHFDGFTADPAAFLATLDGYIQPSHHEGLCIAAHEAMLARLPIIASPVGEMANSIRTSGGGLLAGWADVPALAAAIRQLITDRAGAGAMGEAGQGYVAEYFSADAFTARGRAALRAAGAD
ncbi:MAG: glycosyltransferase [Sphingomonadaceae bacterium]